MLFGRTTLARIWRFGIARVATLAQCTFKLPRLERTADAYIELGALLKITNNEYEATEAVYRRAINLTPMTPMRTITLATC